MPSSTTTLKLPEKLKARIARIAAQSGRSPHAVMLEALEREVAREERVREFVREALASDSAVESGAAVYRAEDVHAWLERLATGEKAPRPRPWRK
jgi:predicted transcriptional regulator